MYADDLTRVRHMLDTAKEIAEYTSIFVRLDIQTNHMLYHALKDCLSTIGEAAFKITRNFRDTYPQVEWLNLVGLRNEMVHDYFVIDREILWDTATQAIPQFIVHLKQILSDTENRN